MTQHTERLFDYRRIQARMARAERLAGNDSDFLHRIAADDLADRLAATNRPFSRALDLFSGRPVLAMRLAHERPEINIERIGDGEAGIRTANRDNLALEKESIDLAISTFGLHRSNDLPGTLLQIRRALMEDGLFMAVMPGEGTLAELRDCLLAYEAATTGGAQLRVEPFIEIRQAGALLQRAGFALPVVDMEKLILRYRSLYALLQDMRALGATSALAGKPMPLPKATLAELDGLYHERYGDADGRIKVTVNLVYMTAWAPHPDQQKPLAPGTAQTSLSKILGR
jgi:hypothetical protein